ncbi:maleylacetoacetate isomerase [Fusarium albosuccineum]|uniref:Maleylacetoacetate isomerase n=1 Tax=Fusarium albosuccineum TaxID=1237068 RepID=A0A8H4L779_9HYPO|nr:maleylacetoacetate isomerase [Fusarium albosuccineum]
MAPQFTLYSFVGSQWAGVPHLAIAEKGISKNDYIVKEVDLVTAENFEPEYLKINPHGTVPSLVSSSLEKALVQSADILRYVDNLGKPSLVPTDPEVRKRSQEIIDLVHSHDADTNTILFTARDNEEMKAKKASMWNGFLQNRQDKLEKEHTAAADNAFYRFKRAENASVQILYATDIGKDHEHFYERSHQSYKAFANSLNKLEELLVGPYAAGDSVTEADFHVVPWLSHALWGAGTEPSQIQNFEVLEALIHKSEPGFSVGPKTKAWWKEISETKSFKEVFPHLH